MYTVSTFQRFVNGEVHTWYRHVLGYNDDLVCNLLDEFGVEEGETVLDPFCGAGTTLVECMKRGVNAVGIDANPFSCFAAKVKTNWRLDPGQLLSLAAVVQHRFEWHFAKTRLLEEDPIYVYIVSSGMLDRGWINRRPLRKVIAIRRAILELDAHVSYKNALVLALASELVRGSSNMDFGPEIYCGPRKKDAAVLSGFLSRVEQMIADLETTKTGGKGLAEVIRGDSRVCSELLRQSRKIGTIITSPPYPTEHDYTRNTRLELVLLGMVVDLESLRRIKKTMIRSHTKGIYLGDSDAKLVAGHSDIERLARKIDVRAKNKTYGFARLYSRVLREYFGGMKRHLVQAKQVLPQGSFLGYVIGDQSSYLRVHIPTAQILSSIAKEIGFKAVGIRRWRTRVSGKNTRSIHENILVLQRP